MAKSSLVNFPGTGGRQVPLQDNEPGNLTQLPSSNTAAALTRERRSKMEKDQAGRTAETNGVTQGQLNSEIKAVERLLDNRFLEIKSSIDLIARSLDSTTRKISEDASRIERLTVGNFEKLDRKIDANASALTVESRANFRTTLWTIVGLFLTIIAVVIGILALVLQAFSSGSLVD